MLLVTGEAENLVNPAGRWIVQRNKPYSNDFQIEVKQFCAVQHKCFGRGCSPSPPRTHAFLAPRPSSVFIGEKAFRQPLPARHARLVAAIHYPLALAQCKREPPRIY